MKEYDIETCNKEIEKIAGAFKCPELDKMLNTVRNKRLYGNLTFYSIEKHYGPIIRAVFYFKKGAIFKYDLAEHVGIKIEGVKPEFIGNRVIFMRSIKNSKVI